jgi:hypothetical protein
MTPPDIPVSASLHAGPPAANPPLLLAVMVICISIIAPLLFRTAGAPNLLLGVAVLALAAAGILTALGAIRAQLRRRADAAIRLRASIAPDGITFHRQPYPAAPEIFPRALIKRAWLLNRALIVETTPDHANPGRYRLGFGKLQSSRNEILTAIEAVNQSIDNMPV